MELILTGCVIALIILFTIHRQTRIEIAELRDALLRLQYQFEALRQTQRITPAETPKQEPEEVLPAASTEVLPEQPAFPINAAPEPAPVLREAPATQKPHTDLEQQFGGKAFVWIGGIALALAGFFLVKYSIETGFLTEKVRVVLGLVFGLGLLGGSHVVRRMERLSDGTRIAQALAGAGIADLYGSLFAATTLYHLVPSWLGFAGMTAVTATAMVLSLRHGSPIALLGLVGGFTTPLLIHGDPNTPLLFGYLYLVCAGLLAVARQQDWWWLSLPALGLSFVWVIVWLAIGHGPESGFWLSLFLLAVALTAMTANRAPAGDAIEPRLARVFAPAGALLVMVAVGFSSSFGLFEWAAFALLSAAVLLLSFFDAKSYRGVPWLALAANLVMLAIWSGAPSLRVALVMTGFAALFGAGSQILIRRGEDKVTWAGLSATAALAYFLLAYAKLDGELIKAIGKTSADFVWAVIACAAAAWFAIALTQTLVLNSELRLRRILEAMYASAATALVSLALAIVLQQDYLPFAVALEVFALSWIAGRLEIAALRMIAMVLTGLFGLLLLPALGNSFLWGHPSISDDIFHFLLPAGLFAAASQNWRSSIDDRFVELLEGGSAFLGVAFVYRLIAVITGDLAWDYTLAVGSLQSAVMLGLALGLTHLADQSGRRALRWAGWALAGVGLMRVVVWQLGSDNPVLAHQWVGALPVLNVIALAYGLPAFLIGLLSREFAANTPCRLASRIAAYSLGAVTIAFWVRQLFEGSFLDAGATSNAELYAYSAAGLISGVVLLLLAVRRGDSMMRVVSLVVMLATVGKVFLIDAAALTGLWRVVSFLGLGFSLLGLSWFYSRFVFTAKKEP